MKETTLFFDIPVQRLNYTESLNAVTVASQESPVRVFFVRPYSLALALDDRCYRRCLQLAEFCLSEGWGLYGAARFLRDLPFPKDIRSVAWVSSFLDHLHQQSGAETVSLLCLGGRYATSDVVEHAVKARWPSLKFLGARNGDWAFADEQETMRLIEACHPTVLLLGMESPEQERFVCHHWHMLKFAGIRVVIGGGEAIDAIAGAIPMAPRLVRSLHLDWLLQMVLEPSRLYRYVKGGVRFVWYVIHKNSLNGRLE